MKQNSIGKRNYPELTKEDRSEAQTESLTWAREYKRIKKSYLRSFPTGYKFTPEDKQSILHIYYRLKTHKKFQNLRDQNLYELTSLLFGCCENTVKKVIDTDGLLEDQRFNRIITQKEIPLPYKSLFEKEINENRKIGIVLASPHFHSILKKNGIDVSKQTLVKKLREWGFNWGTLKQSDIRRNKIEVIQQRKLYMMKLKALENNGLERIYLDESFLHEYHSHSKGWFVPEEREIWKPTGLGRRIAIMGAITESGWLGVNYGNLERELKIPQEQVYEHKSIRYWLVNKKKEDQGNVDAEVFLEYFRNCIIENLRKPSIIILDNAGYHKTYKTQPFVPNSACSIKVLKLFLRERGVKFKPFELKKVLLEKAKAIYKRPKFQVEEIAEEKGHTVLFLPPYHPELNPIEMGWAQVKRFAARVAPYKKDVMCEIVLPQIFPKINEEVSKKLFDHVKIKEETYKEDVIEGNMIASDEYLSVLKNKELKSLLKDLPLNIHINEEKRMTRSQNTLFDRSEEQKALETTNVKCIKTNTRNDFKDETDVKKKVIMVKKEKKIEIVSSEYKEEELNRSYDSSTSADEGSPNLSDLYYYDDTESD